MPRRSGFDFYKRKYMTELKREQKLKCVDNNIINLINKVNQHPDFVTTLSCGGHLKTCTPKLVTSFASSSSSVNLQRAACYIHAADDMLHGRENTIDTILRDNGLDGWICDSQPPFLQFLCRDKDKYRLFFDHLSSFHAVKPNIVAQFHESGDEYLYGYFPDESYTMENMMDDHISPVIGFTLFWKYFITGWKMHVDRDDNVNMNHVKRVSFSAIESFPAHSKCVCHAQVQVMHSEHMQDRDCCDIDLFGDRWTDQWIDSNMKRIEFCETPRIEN